MTAAELHSRITDKEEFIILGQRLRPLCVGHLEMLSNFGCEFPKNPGELALAVLICAQRPRNVVGWFRSRVFRWQLAWLKAWLGEWDFAPKAMLWQEYWKFHTQMPTITRDGRAESSQCGVPWHQSIRAILLSRLNYKPEAIADVPVLQAQWDIAALHQYEGRVKVMNEDLDDRPAMSPETESRIADLIRKHTEGNRHG